MAYEPRTFAVASKKLRGIPHEKLRLLVQTVYPAAISRLDQARDALAVLESAAPAKKRPSEQEAAQQELKLVDVKRAAAVAEARVMLLETFLGNLGGQGGVATGRVAETVDRDFGDFESYARDLHATAQAAAGLATALGGDDANDGDGADGDDGEPNEASAPRGGFALTALSLLDGVLRNLLLDADGNGLPVGCVPIVVLDVCEYAVSDIGADGNEAEATKKKDRDPVAERRKHTEEYVDALFGNLDWDVASARLERLARLLEG